MLFGVTCKMSFFLSFLHVGSGPSGEVLRPSILWNDQRTQQQCDDMTEKIGFSRLIELTGNRALTGFTAPKILWVRDNEPAIYAKCAHILLPKDYIRFMLNYGRVNVEGGPLAATVDPLSTQAVDKRDYSVDVLAARKQLEF